tara:strand:- start:363 stop:719 length:357 start_codon:yes stop_codon:yes gene_type:complete
MKGPFKLKYNKSSFPFKEEEGNAIVAAAASANEEIERGEGGVASFLSGFAGGLSSTVQSKKKNKKEKDKEKPKKRKKNIAYDPKQSGPPPGGYSVEKPGPDPKTEIEIKKKKPGYYGV